MGWQPTRRARRLLDEPARTGGGLDLLAALVAGVVGIGVLVVLVVVVIAVVNSPGRPVDQAETELRNAATAMERFHEEHGHYDTEALEPRTWGYRTEHVDVWIEPHIPPYGHTYCLEGHHADIHPPVASFDPARGFVRDGSCRTATHYRGEDPASPFTTRCSETADRSGSRRGTGSRSPMAASTPPRGDGIRMDISEREAFLAMRFFLEQFYARAGNDMETLIADITLEDDGRPLDPAAWDDWTRCIERARRG